MGLKKETVKSLRNLLGNESLANLLKGLEEQIPDSDEADQYVAQYYPIIVRDVGKLTEAIGKLTCELGTCKLIFDPPPEEIG